MMNDGRTVGVITILEVRHMACFLYSVPSLALPSGLRYLPVRVVHTQTRVDIIRRCLTVFRDDQPYAATQYRLRCYERNHNCVCPVHAYYAFESIDRISSILLCR